MKHKGIIAAVLLTISVLTLASCGKASNAEQEPAKTNEPQPAPAETNEAQPAPAETPAKTGPDALVVYFSATGTTKGIAEKIAAVTGADIYEIVAAQEYTKDDLNWQNSNSRTTHEQNDSSARPEIAGSPLTLDGYTKIYIGYPIWWGEEPRIMDTFVESYNFDGITMIPFCTSGGSGVGSSDKNLKDNAGSGTWLNGTRLKSSASEDDIRSWIDGMK